MSKKDKDLKNKQKKQSASSSSSKSNHSKVAKSKSASSSKSNKSKATNSASKSNSSVASNKNSKASTSSVPSSASSSTSSSSSASSVSSASSTSASKSNSASNSSASSSDDDSDDDSDDISSNKTSGNSTMIAWCCAILVLAIVVIIAILVTMCSHKPSQSSSVRQSHQSTYVMSAPRGGYDYDEFLRLTGHKLYMEMGYRNDPKNAKKMKQQLSKMQPQQKQMANAQIKQQQLYNKTIPKTHFVFNINHIIHEKGQDVLSGSYNKAYRDSSSFKSASNKQRHSIHLVINHHNKDLLVDPKTKNKTIIANREQAKMNGLPTESHRINDNNAKNLLKSDHDNLANLGY